MRTLFDLDVADARVLRTDIAAAERHRRESMSLASTPVGALFAMQLGINHLRHDYAEVTRRIAIAVAPWFEAHQ